MILSSVQKRVNDLLFYKKLFMYLGLFRGYACKYLNVRKC